jgi:hypothetical protein
VGYAGAQVELHLDAGLAELGCVGGVLVAEDVDLADLDVGRRQVAGIFESGWGCRGRDVGPAGSIAE